jgi:hypothetical protein
MPVSKLKPPAYKENATSSDNYTVFEVRIKYMV